MKRSLPRRIATIERIAWRAFAPWISGYIRGKLWLDPVYDAALEILGPSPHPVLDVGCGMGLLACWLREHGCAQAVVGFDPDAGKIERAHRLTRGYRDMAFHIADAATHAGVPGNVAILDVLHYLDAAAQREMLTRMAAHVPPGGVMVLRVTLGDESRRFQTTIAEERWLRMTGWMKFDARHFPTAAEITEPLVALGFTAESRTLWGRTPFNSHLFTFRRPAAPGGGV